MKIVLLPVSVYILDDRSLVLACGDEDYFWSEFDSASSRVELSRTTVWLFVVTLWFLPLSLFFSSSVFYFYKEKFPPKVVPGGHCGVSQEQILLSFRSVLWRKGRSSIRRSPNVSRLVTLFKVLPFHRQVKKVCQSRNNFSNFG